MNLIFLPYSDDIRDLGGVNTDSLESGCTPNTQHIIAAKMMINAMTIDFDSKNFENPEIQNLYAHIQALALDEKEVEPVEDYLQPDEEGLENISNLITGFRDVVYGEDGYMDPDTKAKTAKRLGKRVSSH
jgi:non-homologous end joining protein Ku